MDIDQRLSSFHHLLVCLSGPTKGGFVNSDGMVILDHFSFARQPGSYLDACRPHTTYNMHEKKESEVQWRLNGKGLPKVLSRVPSCRLLPHTQSRQGL